MRLSSIVLTITSLVSMPVMANPTGDAAEMDNIEKRGCGTGNWCCTVANPSTYCANYCRGGSQYLNCGASYVSGYISLLRLRVASGVIAYTEFPLVPTERTMPMFLPLRIRG